MNIIEDLEHLLLGGDTKKPPRQVQFDSWLFSGCLLGITSTGFNTTDLILGNDDSIGELFGQMDDLLDDMLLKIYKPKSGM